MVEIEDITDRLRAHAAIHKTHGTDGVEQPTDLSELLEEAATNIEFLRKQSRGHFETMSVVLRDGIEAILPETAPKKAN